MDRSALITSWRAVFVALALAASGAPAVAQDPTPDTTDIVDDDALEADSTDGVAKAALEVVTAYAVPDMPAAAFLGGVLAAFFCQNAIYRGLVVASRPLGQSGTRRESGIRA